MIDTLKNDTTKKKLGTFLVAGGLVSWFSLMVYIVYMNEAHQQNPSLSLIFVTLACWGVFFVGKTILKTR